MDPNHAPSPNPFMSGYGSMHMQAGIPPINPAMPLGPSAAQMSSMLQQQAMSLQYVAPRASTVFGGMSPVAPGMLSPGITPLMGNAHRARQLAVEEQNKGLAFTQSGAGFGARMLGGLGAGMLGGPVGWAAYEGLGLGQGLQNAVGNVFNPIVDARARALHLQNMSTNFVVGGNSLSASGQGMSMAASTAFTAGLGRMADDRGFRLQTGGAFNRADLDRITRLSGELGMLDQSQSADQMLREVKRVSKALSNFMRIAEEPDIQRAMQQMAKFRTMGFSTAEMPVAAANARTFARMAGVSINQAMVGAEQGSAIFQAHGLSGASGFNAGLGAMGAAAQAAAGLSPRQLALAGGREGMAQTFMQASAQAQTLDAFLPAVLSRRNGRLGIDQEQLRNVLSGRYTPAEMARMGTNNIRQLGGRGAVEELFTRRRELQDEMSASLSPEQQMLMPLVQASMIQRQTGMQMGAALRTLGLDEQQARTLELTASDPNFARNMQRQLRISARERAATRAAGVRARDTFRGRMGGVMDEAFYSPLRDAYNTVANPYLRFMAEEQDQDEALRLEGDGPSRTVRRSRFGSDVTVAAARDAFTADPAAANRAAAGELARVATVRDEEYRNAARARSFGALGAMFHGAYGFGLTRGMRGGDTQYEMALQGADTGTRIQAAIGLGFQPSAAEMRALGEGQAALSQTLRDRGGSTEERLNRAQGIMAGFGSMGRDRAAELRTAAGTAVRNYVRGGRSFGGLIQSERTQEGLQNALRTELRNRGYDASEIEQAVNDTDFQNLVTEDIRGGLNARDTATLDALELQGSGFSEGDLALSADALVERANDARTSASDRLGMGGGLFGYGAADDPERQAVIDTLSGTGDEASFRQRLLAAKAMQDSDDDATRERGARLERELEEEARRDGKSAAYRRALDAVAGARSALTSDTRERMSASFRGKTAEEAVAMVTESASDLNRANASDRARAAQGVLGEAGARALLTQGAAGIRSGNVRVADANIRRMIAEGASDEDISAAVNTQIQRGIDAPEATASGAGTSAGDEETAATTAAMLNSITQGMERFPGAVGNLNRASVALERSAEHLAEIAGVRHITDVASRGNPNNPGGN